MGLKDLHRKFKAFRVTRSITKVGESNEKKASWMTPITHGFQVVEDRSLIGDSAETELVVAQREQVQELEVWFFGVFDAQVGNKVTKYLQSHLFAKGLNKIQIRRRCKETMKKAHIWARSKMLEGTKGNNETAASEGSAAVIVINGEKIVAANMGDYRAVVSREGVADKISKRYHKKRLWSFNLISGAMLMHRRYASGKPSKRSRKLAVRVEKIDSETDFVILASNGIWEVMNNQEAVNLIWHIDDPKEAAECLAREALARMSKGHISCLVIRFD